MLAILIEILLYNCRWLQNSSVFWYSASGFDDGIFKELILKLKPSRFDPNYFKEPKKVLSNSLINALALKSNKSKNFNEDSFSFQRNQKEGVHN